MTENEAPKIVDLMKVVQEHIEAGCYLDTRHASDRKSQRNISRLEILYVLKHGFHEKRRDRFEQIFKAWSYSIRGRTIDKRELRVVISFEKGNLLIITAIDLKDRG